MLRARFDAASRLTNLPRAVKWTGRALRGLTSFRIFFENARGRAEGREAAKARARHLSADTQHAEFILSLSKDFECHLGFLRDAWPRRAKRGRGQVGAIKYL